MCGTSVSYSTHGFLLFLNVSILITLINSTSELPSFIDLIHIGPDSLDPYPGDKGRCSNHRFYSKVLKPIWDPHNLLSLNVQNFVFHPSPLSFQATLIGSNKASCLQTGKECPRQWINESTVTSVWPLWEGECWHITALKTVGRWEFPKYRQVCWG